MYLHVRWGSWSWNGILPVKEKTDAIKIPIKPKVLELKSFPGLGNYYHRHFQGFTDTLEPLHNLMNCYQN